MLLCLRKITHFYGPRLIFKDVSFEVRPGTVTLLAGPNGAGKSTLLKIMAGLTQPSSGSVDLGAGSDGEEASVGYLGHHTFLYPELTARENLAFWAAMHGRRISADRYDDILARVELRPFAEEKARTFSRGMAQRLNLARVFLLQADILLLDEPGTGLDTRSFAILNREIRSAREAGRGIVWITHSLQSDLRQADMAAILGGKRLSFYGTAKDCLRTLEEEDNAPPPFETPVMARGGEPC